MKRYLFLVILAVVLGGIGCDIMDQETIIYPKGFQQDEEDEEENDANPNT